MNYISLFSGIEAASVAWDQLGWNPVAFAEIEPFCCELLERRFPDVPNLGDVSGVDWTEYEGSVDVIIGGSPCQAFSMAGRRLGLMDERGQLMLEFVRCVREVKPRWVIWENVPGVLSQDEGRAFGTLLGELEDCGYALSWRVLDAQFFGVPQRRRRVFLIGHPLPGCAAGVLFKSDSLRGDNPSSREKRAQLAADAQERTGSSYTLKLRHTGTPCIGGGSGPLIQDDLSATLATSQDQVLFQSTDVLPIDTTQVTDPRNGSNPQWGDPCHTMSAQGHTPAVCIGFSAGQSAQAGSIAAQEEIAPTLRAAESGTNQVPSVVIPINEQIATRCNKLGEGTGLGIGDDGDPAYTITAAHPHAVAYAIAGNIIGREPENGGHHLGIEDDGACFTLTATDRHAVCVASGQANAEIMDELCPTQSARQHKDPAIVCMIDSNGHSAKNENIAGTIKHGGEPPVVASNYTVRRLMPVECERLQGFPDGWTDLGGTTDSARYKALGNSMAVPVILWLGQNIEAIENL